MLATEFTLNIPWNMGRTVDFNQPDPVDSWEFPSVGPEVYCIMEVQCLSW